jgi:hypothetical protein
MSKLQEITGLTFATAAAASKEEQFLGDQNLKNGRAIAGGVRLVSFEWTFVCVFSCESCLRP